MATDSRVEDREHRDPVRRRHRGNRAILAAAVAWAASAAAQDPTPMSVLTFDRELVNWATAVERTFEFPGADVSVGRIAMTIQLDCPGGGCDPWDRGATVFVRGRNAAGQLDQFEIARFITPYGRGCSWEVDVTDYRIFLTGSASLGFYIETWIGGDRGWLVTLSFDFYPGAPEREVASIENLWRGRPVYGDPGSPIAGFFTQKTLGIDPSAVGAKLRFFVTGHGQGNTDNAAEFARKLHRVRVNSESFDHYLWRDDCDQNPCSPQGGTWQYARAGWCPGLDAPPWDIDISGSVPPGEPATVLYEVEPYTNRCRPTAACTAADCIWGNCDYDSGSHTPPVYWVESQLITYRRTSDRGQTFVFQQGVDGYAGTVDTTLLEASPGSSRATTPQLSVDGDDGAGRETQVLIRFDDVFGEEPGRIPLGSWIRSARIELTTTDAGDGAAAHRMRVPWSDAATWSTFGSDGIRAGVEAFPEPDGVANAAAGGTVSIDVTAALDEWARTGCPTLGWVLLPSGTNGWDVSSSEGASPPRLVVQTRPLVGDLLIAAGDEWRYLKGTQAPPAAWSERDFVPGAGWLTGPTGIGYEDDDDRTVLDDMQGSYPSVFCRREFRAGPLVQGLRLRIDYDDGFAAYLNGTEVARSTSLAAPGVQLAWNLLAADSHEAGSPEIFDLSTSPLVEGSNVLAIQIHNSALDSSDLSLVPELFADHAVVPPGARWRFLRGSAPLPTGWTAPGFDDSSWESGPVGIGYGDGDDVTELLDMQDAYAAVFCRVAFDLRGLDRMEAAEMRVVYDDGIVVFANGAEVARLNVPPGAVSASLFARSAVEPEPATIVIPRDRLAEGRNVIAVSVHNASLDSSDLSFDPTVVPRARRDTAACGTPFRRGDCNDDGRVDVSDAIFALGSLFLGQGRPACDDACDANDDGAVDVSDAIATLGALFLGQGPVPPPGMSDCGVDPTDEALDCGASLPCS